ncbi:WAP four-disulfide core domain protein 12-like isoform X2 [Notamacropus eugenii]
MYGELTWEPGRPAQFLPLTLTLCIIPGKVKAGRCPIDNVRCFREDPPQCNRDQQCLKEQKCCYYRCGFKCVKPIGTKDPASSKPGKCPNGRCHMKGPQAPVRKIGSAQAP